MTNTGLSPIHTGEFLSALKVQPWMIEPVLEGRKTMTRRPVRPQPNPAIGADRALRAAGYFGQDGRVHYCPWSKGQHLWLCSSEVGPRDPVAGRIRIVDTRAERVQEITWDDVVAEGVEIIGRAFPRGGSIATAAFADLWDSIYGEELPWDRNPWVWVLTMEVVS